MSTSVFTLSTCRALSSMPRAIVGRHGAAAAGDLFVGREHGVVDHFFVGARVAHRGRGAHDDLFAGHGHHHGMALQRLGHVGHRAGPVEFVAGEEAGQLVGVFELRALTGVGGPFRDDEFEHEDGPLVVGGGQGPLDRLLHAEHDAVIDRQRNADPLALPAGAFFLVLRGSVGSGGGLLRLLLPGRQRQNGSIRPPAPAGRIPAGEDRIADEQRAQRYRS